MWNFLGELKNFSKHRNFLGDSSTRKDGGSNAKRQRAQSYDTRKEEGASVKEGGPASGPDRRREGGFEGAGQATPSSPVDDDSSGGMSTETDRQPLREVGGVSAPITAAAATNLAAMDPRQIEARQAEEKEFIRSHDRAEAHIWYLVDVQWLQAWKQFVTRGGMLPGPIDNGRLIDLQTGLGRPGLRAVGDYRGVNETVWYFWHARYGGGPVICRKQLDLYSPPAKEPEDAVGRPRLPGANPSSDPNVDNSASQLGSRGGNPWRPQARSEEQARGEREEARSDSSARSAPSAARLPLREDPPRRETADKASSSGSASRKAQGNSSSSSSLFSLGGSRSHASSSTRTPSSAARGRGGGVDAETPDDRPASKALTCDKCDGPHKTDKCPHFKKARETHQDAWANKGKAQVIADESAHAPVIRSDSARVVSQPGDGSCLFHSLSYGLNDRSSASSLRREICGYMAKNPDMQIADTSIKDWIQYDSNDSVAAYAERMSGGTWGGGIEMAALTRMKNVNVHVYEKCREGYRRISTFQSPQSPGSSKTVSVLYQGRMHYDAIEVR